MADDLKLYLEDDTQAWVLDTDGGYSRTVGEGQMSAQMRLMKLYDDRVALTEG